MIINELRQIESNRKSYLRSLANQTQHVHSRLFFHIMLCVKSVALNWSQEKSGTSFSMIHDLFAFLCRETDFATTHCLDDSECILEFAAHLARVQFLLERSGLARINRVDMSDANVPMFSLCCWLRRFLWPLLIP